VLRSQFGEMLLGIEKVGFAPLNLLNSAANLGAELLAATPRRFVDAQTHGTRAGRQ
jgi:hypothetical protein